jgi:hypothetical protein
MAGSAAPRSAGRLHPSDRAVVFLFVIALLATTASIYGTPGGASASRPQCNNRIDDDGDRKIDYPADPGCTGKRDRSELDPVPPPPPPPPPPPGQVTLQAVDGGPNYYAQFNNPLPSSPAFFPLAVWGSYAHDMTNIAKDQAVGINTYVWVADKSPAFMQNIREAGQHAISDSALNSGVETHGWLLDDEVDMRIGTSACTSSNNARKLELPNDGRFYYSNYGKGVMFWGSDADAAACVNYDEVNSDDIYWFTDGGVCSSPSEGPRFYGLEGIRALTQAECRRARNYGDVVQEMRRLDALNASPRHPIWNFVEVGCPFNNGMCITPAQARAAVWHSLIAGARGILYFQHNFSGPCRTHHALRANDCNQPMITMITSVNALIASIAPALNGPKLTSGFSANANVRAVAKWDGQNFYVLAGSAANGGPFQGNLAIPCVGNATATVLGENRSVPVTNGAFTDQFADGNAVHLYRIDGGSSCGLG